MFTAMTAVDIPEDLRAWAESDVAAGRAKSVAAITAKALAGYRRALEDFRQSIADAIAESDENGWLDAEEVFSRIKSELADEIAREEPQRARSA